MSEFFFLFRGEDTHSMGYSPEKLQEYMAKWMQWIEGLQRNDQFIGAQPLMQTGRLLRENNQVVSDGGFLEGTEKISGYLLCKANDYDEATRIAGNCPILEYGNGSVEIREIQEA
ncbi:MAG: YciI family protein [Ferruginibacter sp.]